ncbi:hypothetical protein F5890DRAFT_1586601 [Lentinula detonsa]|uniref:Uncharacterized protein n=1 Tax=Lentinula detonsa TaxID=2804962 RepID=A0AA38PXR9_9AGAR|nr:hypothetical protein F5890DRAFT_1586601 [Lentinula detonsa]
MSTIYSLLHNNLYSGQTARREELLALTLLHAKDDLRATKHVHGKISNKAALILYKIFEEESPPFGLSPHHIKKLATWANSPAGSCSLLGNLLPNDPYLYLYLQSGNLFQSAIAVTGDTPKVRMWVRAHAINQYADAARQSRKGVSNTDSPCSALVIHTGLRNPKRSLESDEEPGERAQKFQTRDRENRPSSASSSRCSFTKASPRPKYSRTFVNRKLVDGDLEPWANKQRITSLESLIRYFLPHQDTASGDKRIGFRDGQLEDIPQVEVECKPRSAKEITMEDLEPIEKLMYPTTIDTLQDGSNSGVTDLESAVDSKDLSSTANLIHNSSSDINLSRSILNPPLGEDSISLSLEMVPYRPSNIQTRSDNANSCKLTISFAPALSASSFNNPTQIPSLNRSRSVNPVATSLPVSKLLSSTPNFARPSVSAMSVPTPTSNSSTITTVALTSRAIVLSNFASPVLVSSAKALTPPLAIIVGPFAVEAFLESGFILGLDLFLPYIIPTTD